MTGSRNKSFTVAVGVAAVAWFMLLVGGLAYAAYLQDLGSAFCVPFEGSSQYGEFRWSILPPGPTCSFTMSVHGFDETRGPTPVMSIWIVVLALGLLTTIALLAEVRRQGRNQVLA